MTHADHADIRIEPHDKDGPNTKVSLVVDGTVVNWALIIPMTIRIGRATVRMDGIGGVAWRSSRAWWIRDRENLAARLQDGVTYATSARDAEFMGQTTGELAVRTGEDSVVLRLGASTVEVVAERALPRSAEPARVEVERPDARPLRPRTAGGVASKATPRTSTGGNPWNTALSDTAAPQSRLRRSAR